MVKRLSTIAAILVTFCTTEPEPCSPRIAETVQGNVEQQCVPPNCDDSCYAS